MDQNLGLRDVFSVYRVLLTVKFKVWGSFRAFQVFDDLVSTDDLNIQGSLFR